MTDAELATLKRAAFKAWNKTQIFSDDGFTLNPDRVEKRNRYLTLKTYMVARGMIRW